MKFGDFSPPSSPSPDQQRDALQKGLGRAMQWALTGRLGEEPLMEACLRDQRFDVQVEEPRGAWLWRMIQAAGARDRLRVPILHALHEFSDEHSANQLCELARRYAETGDEAFRARLYEIVEGKPFADSQWLGEEELVDLDGEQAFLFAARVRGRLLAGRQWEWDDGSLIDLAGERLGEEHIVGLLETSSDEAVRRFMERWRQEERRKAERGQHASHGARMHRERMAALAVHEIIQAAETDSKCSWFRGWGRHADEADLRTVLGHLWSVQQSTAIASLLKVFSARALPEFDARIIELCRHADQEIRRRAIIALKPNAHPLIRTFALTEIRKGACHRGIIGLFAHNYQQGDEQRILEAIALPQDENELHWLLKDLIEVLEANPEADSSRLGVVAYASTPCENCRFRAARLLHAQQAAPQWLKEECRHDSLNDCRELAEQNT